MKFLKQLGVGYGSYAKALPFLSRNGMLWVFVFPLLLNIALFMSGALMTSGLSDWINETIASYLPDLDSDWSWVKRVSFYIIWVVIKILYFILFAVIGGYVVLILMAPLLAYISEKTESIMTGVTYKFKLVQLIKDTLRGIIMALRNLFIELLLTVLLFLAGFIPVVGFLSPVALFILSSYYYGFSFMDYYNERRKRNIRDSVRFIRAHKGIAISSGSVFLLLFMIPLIGTFLAGFVAILSVVAGSMSLVKLDLKATPEGWPAQQITSGDSGKSHPKISRT